MTTGATGTREAAWNQQRQDEPMVWVRPAEPDSDAATAIVAHGLLGNLAVIRGAARTLLSERELRDGDRERLLQMLDDQVGLMEGVLTDLVRGLPSHALAALDELRRP